MQPYLYFFFGMDDSTQRGGHSLGTKRNPQTSLSSAYRLLVCKVVKKLLGAMPLQPVWAA